MLTLNLFSQEKFNENAIKKIKITSAQRFIFLDSLNQNSILDAEFIFNYDGKLIKSNYFNGSNSSHGCSINLTESYTYANNKIIEEIRVEFDTIICNYYYFENNKKVLVVKKNKKYERVGLILFEKNKHKQNIIKFQTEFRTTNNDNLCLQLSIFKTIFSKKKQIFIETRKMFKISLNELEIIKSSLNFAQIKELFNNIESNNNLINKEIIKEVFEINDKNFIKKEIASNRETLYNYDKNDLIDNKIISFFNNIKIKYYYKYF